MSLDLQELFCDACVLLSCRLFLLFMSLCRPLAVSVALSKLRVDNLWLTFSDESLLFKRNNALHGHYGSFVFDVI